VLCYQEITTGVNLDEEAANLIRYQQAYSAAARIISIANETFDSLLQAVR
jgi:flagellar hook-associated protein 1 FlgK